MSTIKSSDEHLTLNADGTSKDIKFQANGVEKASIDASGNLTVTGAVTADNLTVNGTGTSNFTSTATSPIQINGTSIPTLTVRNSATPVELQMRATTTEGLVRTATNHPLAFGVNASEKMRIDSSGNVGIGQTSPSSATGVAKFLHIGSSSDAHSGLILEDNSRKWEIQNNDNLSFFAADVEKLQITSDGRGLSQFTAKAWVNFNGTSTVAIRDSHNVSSISDNGTGNYGVNFSNNIANTNYSVVLGLDFLSWDSQSGLSQSNNAGNCNIYTWRSAAQSFEDQRRIDAIIFGD